MFAKLLHHKLSWLKENKNNENMKVSMSENVNVSMWFRVWVRIKAWWFTASSRCSRESRSFEDGTGETEWKRKKENCLIFSVKSHGCHSTQISHLELFNWTCLIIRQILCKILLFERSLCKVSNLDSHRYIWLILILNSLS